MPPLPPLAKHRTVLTRTRPFGLQIFRKHQPNPPFFDAHCALTRVISNPVFPIENTPLARVRARTAQKFRKGYALKEANRPAPDSSSPPISLYLIPEAPAHSATILFKIELASPPAT